MLIRSSFQSASIVMTVCSKFIVRYNEYKKKCNRFIWYDTNWLNRDIETKVCGCIRQYTIYSLSSTWCSCRSLCGKYVLLVLFKLLMVCAFVIILFCIILCRCTSVCRRSCFSFRLFFFFYSLCSVLFIGLPKMFLLLGFSVAASFITFFLSLYGNLTCQLGLMNSTV